MNDILMTETFRWYGPNDRVTLSEIRQCGCEGVITSLHHIPYGDVWTREEIKKRKDMVDAAGLKWVAVESVPVHEDIKTRTGNFEKYIENYKISIENLGAEGLEVVIYNFMPVLDWVRTNVHYKLPDGTECLHYDPVRFAAFEIYFLKRKGAEADYSPLQLEKAKEFYDSMSQQEKDEFEKSIIDVFPGCKMGLGIEDVRAMLAKYDNIDADKLKEHLSLFLNAVCPVADKANVRLAIHPDDPPFSIMGLPRIVSNENDIQQIVAMYDKPSNGLCFCTGSYSPRGDNDIVNMIKRWGHRINVMHLRSTQRCEDGCFYEADHLGGSVDMYGAIRAVLEEMAKRKAAGRKDWKLSFRPDHGHTMLDDLNKPQIDNPGYTAIGRLRGLSEIRGLQLGISRSIFGD